MFTSSWSSPPQNFIPRVSRDLAALTSVCSTHEVLGFLLGLGVPGSGSRNALMEQVGMFVEFTSCTSLLPLGIIFQILSTLVVLQCLHVVISYILSTFSGCYQ